MELFEAELDANRRRWCEMAAIHADAEAYDVDGFLDGASTLGRVELSELGDVTGDSLLHLMCHFGLDSLSWAREGADVTGLDFAEVAIETARDLADRADLDARFVCADVHDAPTVLDERFDVVFLSHGVLNFLPDVGRLAAAAEQCLVPGGTLYLVENHPVASAIREIDSDGWAEFAYPYFHEAEPNRYVDDRTYADPDASLDNDVSYDWDHDLGTVVTGILSAGLDLEFLHEFPHAASEEWLGWPNFAEVPGTRRDEEGRWWIEGLAHDVPLRFSVKATKPA